MESEKVAVAELGFQAPRGPIRNVKFMSNTGGGLRLGEERLLGWSRPNRQTQRTT